MMENIFKDRDVYNEKGEIEPVDLFSGKVVFNQQGEKIEPAFDWGDRYIEWLIIPSGVPSLNWE